MLLAVASIWMLSDLLDSQRLWHRWFIPLKKWIRVTGPRPIECPAGCTHDKINFFPPLRRSPNLQTGKQRSDSKINSRISPGEWKRPRNTAVFEFFRSIKRHGLMFKFCWKIVAFSIRFFFFFFFFFCAIVHACFETKVKLALISVHRGEKLGNFVNALSATSKFWNSGAGLRLRGFQMGR